MDEEDTKSRPIRHQPPPFPAHGLSEHASRARRNIIAAFFVWLLVAPLELRPTKIQWLGIEFQNAEVTAVEIVSFAVAFFWISFVVYAYKDWAKWRHECLISLYEADLQIRSQITQNNAIAKGIETAEANFKRPEDPVSIVLPNDGNRTHTNSLADWQKWLPIYKSDLPRLKTRKRQLYFDTWSRTAWDYALPIAAILGPLFGMLRDSIAY